MAGDSTGDSAGTKARESSSEEEDGALVLQELMPTLSVTLTLTSVIFRVPSLEFDLDHSLKLEVSITILSLF